MMREPASNNGRPVTSAMYCRAVRCLGSDSCSCIKLPTLRSRPSLAAPWIASTAPVSVRSSVLLPTPFSPTIATRSPRSTRSDTGAPSTRTSSSYPSTTSVIVMAASPPDPSTASSKSILSGARSTTRSTGFLSSSASRSVSTALAFFPERPARSRLKSRCITSWSLALCRSPVLDAWRSLSATCVRRFCRSCCASYARRCCSLASASFRRNAE
mmetsp:Transcript_9301/g.38149  ORF Transcript_9301/g.38149 Transcript_9301/m.38149 type:complete len:214 (-) Transcript_9301:2181-2822(-)